MDSGQRARASLAVFSRHRVVRFVRMKFPPRPLPPPPTPRQFINPTDDRVRRPTPRYIYIYIKGEVLVVSPPIILLLLSLLSHGSVQIEVTNLAFSGIASAQLCSLILLDPRNRTSRYCFFVSNTEGEVGINRRSLPPPLSNRRYY